MDDDIDMRDPADTQCDYCLTLYAQKYTPKRPLSPFIFFSQEVSKSYENFSPLQTGKIKPLESYTVCSIDTTYSNAKSWRLSTSSGLRSKWWSTWSAHGETWAPNKLCAIAKCLTLIEQGTKRWSDFWRKESKRAWLAHVKTRTQAWLRDMLNQLTTLK